MCRVCLCHAVKYLHEALCATRHEEDEWASEIFIHILLLAKLNVLGSIELNLHVVAEALYEGVNGVYL